MRKMGFDLPVVPGVTEDEEEPKTPYIMPCSTTVGPDDDMCIVDQCDHRFMFHRQETIMTRPDEEDPDRYDVWVCNKCLMYRHVQV